MENKEFELTNPQKSIWLTQQFYENSTINNIAGDLRIDVPCNFEKLEQAINAVIKNNDGYRLKITMTENGVKQYVDEYKYVKVPDNNIGQLIDEALDEIEKEFVKEPFNVIDNNLYNIKLAKFPDDRGVILLNLHHLVSDAWTMILFLNEVYQNYIQIVDGKDIEAFEEKPSYIEFIKSQEEYKKTKNFGNNNLQFYQILFHLKQM